VTMAMRWVVGIDVSSVVVRAPGGDGGAALP